MQNYKIVQLVNGTYSVRSLAEHETFHPVIGPVAEAEALYVKQLKLRERVEKTSGEFVIWDVGLGAAANVTAVFHATRDLPCTIRALSFDRTTEPLQFALRHTDTLCYLQNYQADIENFLSAGYTLFTDGRQTVRWELCRGDFPELLEKLVHPRAPTEFKWPPPHAILFDAFSPAKNPAMWTEKVFSNLFRLLDPQRPCAMPTYSRSTMLRVTLLLAGFFVGVGHATGEKEETTIAANTMELIDEPLDARWLQRARISRSAEPMSEPVYRQAHLSEETWKRLIRHPQFAGRMFSDIP